MKHTISVLVENRFGVLARVAGMFSGRGFNIDTLNVAPTQDPSRSRITVTVKGNDQQLDQAVKQLNRFINVLEVTDFQRDTFVARELILVKVAADSVKRTEVMQICDVFRAKIIDVNPKALIIEATGNPTKIEAFLNMLEPFGILELARTGNLALRRDPSTAVAV
jgi:acetolactate synthase-1/3 small subunit